MEISISSIGDSKVFNAINGNEKVGYAKVSENPSGFLAEDFKASHPDAKVVELYDIYVMQSYRGQHIGSDLISSVIDHYGGKDTSTVILTAAGASMVEYVDEPSDEEKIEIVESLRPFYVNNNFVDVNDLYAGYEFKRAYAYDNETSRKYIEERKKAVEEFEAKK